jgi:hypothetical protein
VSQTTEAASTATVASPAPPHLSLIPIDVLRGFVELLSHPHARDTIIGTSAVNALLTAELVEQVTRIAEWHKLNGRYFFDAGAGAGAAGSVAASGPATSTSTSAAPAAGSGAAPDTSSGSTAAVGPALAVPAPLDSGPASTRLTPFMEDIHTVVLNQLALRDTLIAGLRADLTTAERHIADLKSVQEDLTHQTSVLRTEVTSAHGQLEPLIGRVEQMVLDVARQDLAIQEIARNAAADSNPTAVVIVEEREADPPESPEATAENNRRVRRQGRRR